MLKLKSLNLAKNLIVGGLLALVVFLAACQTTADPAVETFGLRSEAVEELIQPEPSDSTDSAAVSADESAAVAAETAAGGSANANTAGQAARGGQARMADRTNHVIDPLTAADPTQVDIDGLVYMREEEKLARDVYLALYDLWGLPVFQNIAGSEQAHMDSVLMLLEGYGVADPAAGKDPGQFSDPFFQSLYRDLMAQGSASLVEALKVGATIEDLDIVDLQARLKETENVNIIQVYSNLMAGSENHLRAFVSNLERQGGETYQPTYLDQASYEAIIGGTNGNGNGAGGNGGGNGSGGPGNGAGGNGGNGGNGRRNGWGNQA